MKGLRKAIFILSVLFFVGAFFSAPLTLTAHASSTQEKINQAEQEKKEIKNKKDEADAEVGGLKKERNNLKKELEKLQEQLEGLVARLESLDEQIHNKEAEIQETQAALKEAREKEQWQYDCMVARIRYMYERNEDSIINQLLMESSLAKMLNMADYVEKVAAYDRKKMNEFMENRAYIETVEARLLAEKQELDGLVAEAEEERAKVSDLIASTTASISQYTDQISEAEKIAKEYEEELKRKESDLKYLKKKLAEEIALSQAAANAKWRDISEVTFAEGDRKLLANLIYCEAGGEPYAGQLAVGSVVINRVLSSKYPDSVVGVIYANKQFSPVGSGRLALALASDKANASCYRAADEAMTGVTNVGNCVYFRTPVEGLSGISIGGHIFY